MFSATIATAEWQAFFVLPSYLSPFVRVYNPKTLHDPSDGLHVVFASIKYTHTHTLKIRLSFSTRTGRSAFFRTAFYGRTPIHFARASGPPQTRRDDNCVTLLFYGSYAAIIVVKRYGSYIIITTTMIPIRRRAAPLRGPRVLTPRCACNNAARNDPDARETSSSAIVRRGEGGGGRLSDARLG